MKWLMNVAEIMSQQNYRNRFRNLARIIRGNFTTQNANAVRNCMHDIPVATPGLAIAIFLDIERHIGVMHPMMGRRGITSIWVRRIRFPKIVQLLLDLWMREKMNSTPIVGAVLVPTLDIVRNQRSPFQRNTIEKCFDFCRRRRSG